MSEKVDMIDIDLQPWDWSEVKEHSVLIRAAKEPVVSPEEVANSPFFTYPGLYPVNQPNIRLDKMNLCLSLNIQPCPLPWPADAYKKDLECWADASEAELRFLKEVGMEGVMGGDH